MARVYSYTRFSTLEQRKGDSRRRQLEEAERYAASAGMPLDDTLRLEDAGVSGFTGANTDTGALAGFLRLAQDGLIEPGSVLVVENLDRISRQTARRAVRILEDICEAGVAVHTTSDGRTYTVESLDNDALNLIWAVLLFSRAHEESATKSRRLKAAWRNKREALRSGKPLGKRCPAWLKLDGDRYAVIPERARIVRSLFRRVAAGEAVQAVTRDLNDLGTPTWGPTRRGNRPLWHRSYLIKILRNRAVLGEFQPHTRTSDGKREPVGEPIPDYYPAVVTRGDWDAAHAVLGRAAGQVGSSLPHNLFAGIARCAHCDGSVHMRSLGRKEAWRYLICRHGRYQNGLCWDKGRRVRLDLVENRFVKLAPAILDSVAGSDLAEEIASAQHGVWVLEDDLREAAAAVARTGSRTLERHLIELERQREAAEADLRALERRARESAGPVVQRRLQALHDALVADPLDRPAVNLALRAAVDRVVVDFEQNEARLEWRHAAPPLVVDYGPSPLFRSADAVALEALAARALTIRDVARVTGLDLPDARNCMRRLVGTGKARRLDPPVRGREGRYGPA